MNNTNNKKVYIYNPNQVNYYIQNGMKVLGTGIHSRTKKTFWIFDFNETEEIYVKWINNKH